MCISVHSHEKPWTLSWLKLLSFLLIHCSRLITFHFFPFLSFPSFSSLLFFRPANRFNVARIAWILMYWVLTPTFNWSCIKLFKMYRTLYLYPIISLLHNTTSFNNYSLKQITNYLIWRMNFTCTLWTREHWTGQSVYTLIECTFLGVIGFDNNLWHFEFISEFPLMMTSFDAKYNWMILQKLHKEFCF